MSNIILVGTRKVNLDKAKRLGSYQYSNPSDFEYIYEEIYLTSKGNYLFIGEGGAKSKYGTKISTNTWDGSSVKEIISKEEAFEKLCSWGETNAVLECFDDMVEEA